MVKAFLIGAGATKAQYEYAPLSSDFFQILDDTNSLLFEEIEKTVVPHLKNELRKLNIEDVMIESYQMPPSQQSNLLRNIYSAIYELIAERTESTEAQMNGYYSNNTKPETLFKNLIGDERLSSDDFFMTLNYDLYLDREIISHVGKIDYGLDEEYSRKAENQNYSVYHLHGSLNWKNNINNDKITVKAGAIPPLYNSAGYNLCIVPPGKKEFNPILKQIWKIAEIRLMNADELIIIGCSLNVADEELIKLVKKFVNNNGPGKVKIIHNIDKALVLLERETDYDNYRVVIGEGFKEYHHGFKLEGPQDKPGFGAIEFIFGDY